jgi:hypothetical protein
MNTMNGNEDGFHFGGRDAFERGLKAFKLRAVLKDAGRIETA